MTVSEADDVKMFLNHLGHLWSLVSCALGHPDAANDFQTSFPRMYGIVPDIWLYLGHFPGVNK